MFLRFYGQACTRQFGSKLTMTMMIPMADNYNHANVNVRPYIVHGPSHAASDPLSKYFTPRKFMNDYSRVLEQQSLPQHFS